MCVMFVCGCSHIQLGGEKFIQTQQFHENCVGCRGSATASYGGSCVRASQRGRAGGDGVSLVHKYSIKNGCWVTCKHNNHLRAGGPRGPGRAQRP